ncbi:CRISPR-associated endonuclease Cas3'' [Thermococcus prieurii]
MIPCAYFSNGKCIETMEAHIKRGLELIDGLYLARNYGVFLGRLLELDPTTAEDLLRKAYVLHDMGKCLETFQNRRGGFGYHEFYSYLVARKVLAGFGEAGNVASVAILLHHHDWIRKTIVKRPPSLRLAEECPGLIQVLSGLEVPDKIPWSEPVEEYSRVEKTLQSNLRAVYSLLLPIVIADNYAAAINRGGKGSTLGREVVESISTRLLHWIRFDCGTK